MRVLKAILVSIIYIVSAFVMSVLLAVSFFFIKPFFEPSPSKQRLQLSEIVVRSQEVVTGYWQKHQQCPLKQDLLAVSQLALVEHIIIKPIDDQKQCVLTIELSKEYFDNKKINLLFSFSRVKEQSGYLFNCYTNASSKSLPISCGSLRDIDSFYEIN